MKNKYFLLVVVLTIGFVYGCKSKKTNVSVPVDVATVQKYWDAQFTTDYLEARGKASITSNGKTNNVSMHLKMKMDSIIWGKFSLFGIGATVLITEDSFFMVNTLEQEYMAYDNSYLNQFLGFKANITQLQNLLLGNAVFPEENYVLDPIKMQLEGGEGMATNILGVNQKYRTLSSKISTSDTTQSANIQYDKYENVMNSLMPKIVSIDVRKGGNKLDVVLNYQNVNTYKIATFPFNIPNGFTKKYK